MEVSHSFSWDMTTKGTAIPVQARPGPEASRRLKRGKV
jgi:hypothetical protein